MANNYTRRKYNSVKNDFIVLGRSWTNGIFNRSITAITPDGIWLSELTLTNALIEYGFFEWNWIDSIMIVAKEEIAYFIMKDMDACLSSVCTWQFRFLYKKSLVTTLSNGKRAFLVRLELLSPELLTYIADNKLVKIETILK